MNLAIVGSRCHRALVQPYRLARDLPADVTVVSGRAEGVDIVAEIAARQTGRKVIAHPADWRPNGVYDPAAGFKRNALIERDSDECDAFPDGDARGTSHTIGLFNKAGKPIRVHEPEAPSILLFTAQIWYAKARLPHAFDITRGSGGAAGDPFAPSKNLLDAALPWLKTEPDRAWAWYEPLYQEQARASWRRHRNAWETALAKTILIGCCFCAERARCHRRLWVSNMIAAGKATGRAVYDGGEVPRFL